MKGYAEKIKSIQTKAPSKVFSWPCYRNTYNEFGAVGKGGEVRGAYFGRKVYAIPTGCVWRDYGQNISGRPPPLVFRTFYGLVQSTALKVG